MRIDFTAQCIWPWKFKKKPTGEKIILEITKKKNYKMNETSIEK